MLIYYILFLFFLFLTLIRDYLTISTQKQLVIISGVILSFFAGLRAPNIDNDYMTYLLYYVNVDHLRDIISTDLLFKTKLEPTFIFLSAVFKHLFFSNGFAILIFVYAVLGVMLTVKGINKVSEYPLLSFLIFFSGLFFLMDMTQIRSGVAIGFIFLSLPHLKERNLIPFSLYILAATAFHYSALLFVFAYVLNQKHLSKTIYFTILLVPLFLNIIGFDFIKILTTLKLGVYTDKLDAYIIAQKWLDEDINLFNFSILFQILLSLFFIYFSDKIDNPYAIIFTKILVGGVVVFYIFSFSPVLAFRLSELLTSVQIFLIPMMFKVLRPRLAAELVVILISVLYFINQIVINNIFEPYYTIFSHV